MPEQKLFGPIKLSGRALYNDGQMINSNVINHVTKEHLEGVGSRSLFSDASDEHASSAWSPSSSVHFLNTGMSRSNRVIKRLQDRQMRYDLFDVLWSCNPKRRTCSYVHSLLLFLSKMLIVLVSSPCILKLFLQHPSHLLLLLLPACVQLSSVDNKLCVA